MLLAIIAISASGKEKYPPLRVGCSIGFNAVDYNRLKTMKEAGIGAAFQRKETDEYYECVVRIPKSAAHKAS